jgi:uncharacterized protein (TIGR03083 family)
MAGAIDALRADREALLGICEGLSGDEWAAPSGCPGWSVQDVVAHMGALFTVVVDPSSLPDAGGVATEQAQDMYVEARRAWSADQVLGDYRSVSPEAITRLADLGTQTFELPLGDLGTYPASALANAFAFDHYTHIRADLFAPRGPLTGTAPPSDELRVAPALEWVAAALPQQNAASVGSLDGAVECDLTGPGARRLTIGEGPTTAQITSDGAAFVRWITQRGDWDELGVVAMGDATSLATVRQLRVF